MTTPTHRSTADLIDALADIRSAPMMTGTLDLIVRRPAGDRREVIIEGQLDATLGLEGDDWLERGSRHTEDGRAETDRQITVMNSRAIAAVAGPVEHWPLAGDQLYIDLALGADTLPPGSRIELDGGVLEVTAAPHRGCAKFARRFGQDAARFVNSDDGRALNLRGINARVLSPGAIRTGATARVVPGDGTIR